MDEPIPLFEGSRSILAPVWGVQPYLVARALYDVIRHDLPPHWVWNVIPDARCAPLDPWVFVCVPSTAQWPTRRGTLRSVAAPPANASIPKVS